ncbi:MAG: pteridine reductase [Burkholderiales bacterium]|nr:pteridine reductase [Burkholderiales bacterium]
MTAPLSGKVALVTGGAKRVGAAIARRLHAGGASVMIHHRSSASDAKALVGALNAARANSAASVRADLLNLGAVAELVKTTVERFGGLDVLVNNASTFYPTAIGKIKATDWDDLVGTNLKGPLFLAQAAAPHLAKSHGCIVNITDIYAERPLKGYVVYSVAKAGLACLTRSLARELGPDVRVNAVAPGPILWPEDGSYDEVARQRVVSHTLLKRTGDPEDVAQAVYFLVADAPYVTGQTIAVDGGRSVNL